MPEASGKELLEDVHDFWKWYLDGKGLENALSPRLKLDGKHDARKHLLVSGESAGGFLAAWSLLQGRLEIPIKVIYLQYPMLCHYHREFGKGQKTADFAGKSVDLSQVRPTVDKCLAKINALRAEGKIVQSTGATPPERMAITFALSASDQWRKVFGEKDILQMVSTINTELLGYPHIYMFHGGGDINCKPEVTDKFAELLKQKWYKGKLRNVEYVEVPGQTHGFDKTTDENRLDDDGAVIKNTNEDFETKRYLWLKDMNDKVYRSW
jgi:acetyl esterase/lipase